ncbi:MAG: metal ABC transporter permease [Pirellulales bacterium]|nr:metal ABC transporter permease [Pirellulales bacterium]
MSDFIDALRDPLVPFVRYALLAGVLASLSFGVIGSYVVTRRITYIAGAISHSVLGGIGAALYLNGVHGWTWCDPFLGATLAALLSAVVIGLASLYAKQREDTVIGAVWSLGMAIGAVFLMKTPGNVDPLGYLFGNITFVTLKDLWLVLGLDAVVAAVGLGLYPQFLALCFDEEFAELRGVPVKWYYLLLLILTALTVVMLVRVMGIILVIALLSLPPAVAGHFARNLWQMMLGAVLCCAAFVAAGLAVSYPYDLPSGPTIALVAGTAYLVVVLGYKSSIWGRLSRKNP